MNKCMSIHQLVQHKMDCSCISHLHMNRCCWRKILKGQCMKHTRKSLDCSCSTHLECMSKQSLNKCCMIPGIGIGFDIDKSLGHSYTCFQYSCRWQSCPQ